MVRKSSLHINRTPRDHKYHSSYSDTVFINCPFDKGYGPIFRSVVFAIFDCGFVARCALEFYGSDHERFQKIIGLVSECKYGYHDICRTSLDSKNRLPRFNMPFELGLFLSAEKIGEGVQKQKECLIIDRQPYRYQMFISDIMGLEVRSHNGDPKAAVGIVSKWLRSSSGRLSIPGGAAIWSRYERFQMQLPLILRRIELRQSEMLFNEYSVLVSEWLRRNAPQGSE